MAVTTLWDATYESSPSNQIDKSLIPDEIHLLKASIEQRMGLEHFFGPWASPIVAAGSGPVAPPDDGQHWPGHTPVVAYDTLANRSTVAPYPEKGSLFVVKVQENGTTVGQALQLYDGTQWVYASTNTHAALAGITSDDHPQYLLLSGSAARNTMTVDFPSGGKFIYVSTVNGNASNTVWVTESHVAASAPHGFSEAAFNLVPVDPNLDPVMSGGTTNAKLEIKRDANGNIMPLVDQYNASIASGAQWSVTLDAKGFVPSVRVYCSANQGASPAADVPYAPNVYWIGMPGSMAVAITLNGTALVIQNNTTVAIAARVVQFGFNAM